MKKTYESEVRWGKPWFWFIIRWVFKPSDPKSVVVAVGSKIWTEKYISSDLQVHEATHLAQQGFSSLKALTWWIRYLTDKNFRYRQELEAYRNQYRWYAERVADTRKGMFAKRLAVDLSSPLYGSIVTFDQALSEITK